MNVPVNQQLDVEESVRARYSGGAKQVDLGLCCPTAYDPALLRAIPQEVLERDYGCGDPSRHLKPGETVLDLGSGSGKVCFIASQVVGRSGRVIGIDMNDDMLELARRNAPEVARQIGFANVEFRRGRIQDLALDLDALDDWLKQHPVRCAQELCELEADLVNLRQFAPLVAADSIDVIVSNCVLNLVRPEKKAHLFAEMYRVLRNGGRAVISDIVSDEDVPESLRKDAALWSGCVSGALREDAFLEAFERAGFHGITLLERQEEPWKTVDGIEFRSVTVAAHKGKEGPCLDGKHAVIYRGPFRQVEDDDGHTLRRGVRTAVCEKTFRIYSQEPYRDHVSLITPSQPVARDAMQPFRCASGAMVRDAKETKRPAPSSGSEKAGKCVPGNGNGSCC